MSPRKKKHLSKPQIIVIVIIVISMLTVLAAVVCSFVFQPENLVKSKISTLASEYYEEYIYPSFNLDNTSDNNSNNFMQKYEETGLSTTTLRQILLYNHQKNAADAPFLKKYCDENRTFIRFYPEYPYSKTSYRIEYMYSCEF